MIVGETLKQLVCKRGASRQWRDNLHTHAVANQAGTSHVADWGLNLVALHVLIVPDRNALAEIIAMSSSARCFMNLFRSRNGAHLIFWQISVAIGESSISTGMPRMPRRSGTTAIVDSESKAATMMVLSVN